MVSDSLYSLYEKLVCLMFMTLEDEPNFTIDITYAKDLCSKWQIKGYTPYIVSCRVALDFYGAKRDEFRFVQHLTEGNGICVLKIKEVNGNDTLVLDKLPCWEFYYDKIISVVESNDITEYECLFNPDTEITKGKDDKKKIIGKGISAVRDFFNNNLPIKKVYKLPENCIVIAAGNRVSDKSVAYNMPKALANRLCHIEIQASNSAWHDWAVSNNIHPMVVGYIEYNSAMLMGFESSAASLAFTTPRSWEMVSNILKNVNSDINTVYPLIEGCIGSNAASSFKHWCEIFPALPRMKDVFAGKKAEVSNADEVYIALRSLMVDYAFK